MNTSLIFITQFRVPIPSYRDYKIIISNCENIRG